MPGKYFDLLIVAGDFSLNSGNEPERCNNRVSIGQDIAHALIESGLPIKLLAQRSTTLRADIFTQMILLVETDDRIVPGTVLITEESARRLLLTARTYDFGDIVQGVAYEKEY
ncbi:DUF2590 family protein [Pragia fontium]|uniref:DUF2590 family protein n=1 Tax=Pragia fontium DSM 5563 = ATCC 49100 TaxID=1122977 RepID=A0AAJ4W9L1_9GAMM|nr:DUF2590 family protein [Pragia fontium]SFC49984.1 Protein of unknown function [Pragia fontium DSM 5563 = ATCC 49100]